MAWTTTTTGWTTSPSIWVNSTTSTTWNGNNLVWMPQTYWVTPSIYDDDGRTAPVYFNRRPVIWQERRAVIPWQRPAASAIIRNRQQEWEREQERIRAAEVMAHSQEAQDHAKSLLMEFLTQDQQKTFLEHGWFVVEGGRSKRKYRVRASQGLVGNVDVMHDNDNNRIMHRLCAHVRLGEVPLGDQLLAQKLMLQFDEDRFLAVANRHPVFPQAAA